MQATRIIMKCSNICEPFIPNSVYTQCIRWKRKPIWLPTAKSKLFRIPKRPVIPTEEQVEMKRLFNIYRTSVSSLRMHIENAEADRQVQLDEVNLVQVEEEDFEMCSAINDQWNANVAKLREARLDIEREVRKEKALQEIISREEKQKECRMQADEEIRKIKAVAGTFITAENIDAAIEECLANVVNHNRAMDLNGNWYDGKYPPVPAVEEIATQPTDPSNNVDVQQ